MADETPLTDVQVHELLCAAADALGSAPGATVRGDTAIEAARKALALLQIALIAAVDAAADQGDGEGD